MKPKLRPCVLACVIVLAGASAALANEASDRIFEKAKAKFDSNNLEEAAFLFEQAVIADPAVAKTRYWLARTYWENEEVEKAQRAFNQTGDIDPGYKDAFYWGGRADIELEEVEAAEEKYEWLVKLCGDCTQAVELRAAIDAPKEEAFLNLFEDEDGDDSDGEAEENSNGDDSGGDGDSDDNAQ